MVKVFVITCDHDQSAPETLSPRLNNAIGGLAKMVRPKGALMTSAQLATYDEAKRGLVATAVCSPVDVVKTRVMGSHDGRGVMHALRDIVGREGVRWVFRGSWLPSFVRLGPHIVLTFVALGQHKEVWRWFKGERK